MNKMKIVNSVININLDNLFKIILLLKIIKK